MVVGDIDGSTDVYHNFDVNVALHNVMIVSEATRSFQERTEEVNTPVVGDEKGEGIIIAHH